VVTRIGKGKDRLSLCRMTGTDCQSGYSAFQIGYALFQHIVGRVIQTRVDVAKLLKREQIGRMFCVAEWY